MTDYDILLDYKRNKQLIEKLQAELSTKKLRNLFRRKRKDVVSYYIRENHHEKKISQEEYLQFYKENAEYRKLSVNIHRLQVSNEKIAPRISDFEKNVIEEFQKLSKMEQKIPKNNFLSEELEIRTLRGDYVRSKSEGIIADALFVQGIHYEYESTETGAGMHPDFYIHDNIRGIPIIWEHFGKMNDIEYVQKVLLKLRQFEKAGYTPGYNLIVTYESYYKTDRQYNIIFSSNEAEKIVKEWFLPEGVITGEST